MSFLSTPDKDGLYFAYMTPAHVDTSYTEFQPALPRIPGKHTFKAIFSSFVQGAGSKDNYCGSGADGGPGVSCSVRFEAKLNQFYSIRLKVSSKDSDSYYYTGDVDDDSTNKQVVHWWLY